MTVEEAFSTYGYTPKDDPTMFAMFSAGWEAKPSPAWEDAPTCAGLWIAFKPDDEIGGVAAFVRVEMVLDVPFDGDYRIRKSSKPEDGKWYGPIPEDTQGESEGS